MGARFAAWDLLGSQAVRRAFDARLRHVRGRGVPTKLERARGAFATVRPCTPDFIVASVAEFARGRYWVEMRCEELRNPGYKVELWREHQGPDRKYSSSQRRSLLYHGDDPATAVGIFRDCASTLGADVGPRYTPRNGIDLLPLDVAVAVDRAVASGIDFRATPLAQFSASGPLPDGRLLVRCCPAPEWAMAQLAPFAVMAADSGGRDGAWVAEIRCGSEA